MRPIIHRVQVLFVLLGMASHVPVGLGEDPEVTANSSYISLLDANEIGMYFSNTGFLAHIDTMPYYERSGFFYPIDSSYALMYSAWLWLAAEVESSVRVAIVESTSEFAPGPLGHPAVEDSSVFRVYKIGSEDADSTSEDRDEWPKSFGAPIDDSEQPLVTGDQSIWTVFNDGDVLRHTRRGGSTSPLGAEVQLYAYAYADSGSLDRMVFIEFKIINKSQHDWTGFMAGILADPDLGTASDDLSGTDSAKSLAYSYSYEHDKIFPTGFFPAVGVAMLESPSSENDGPISGSANVFVNIGSSRSVESTVAMMSGRYPDGEDYVDPTTGLVTRYPFGGDPRLGTGWLDSGKGDRKIMITSAPADVDAGDTTYLAVAFLATWGGSNFEALTELFRLANSAYDFHAYGSSGVAAVKNVRDGSIQSVSFSPPEQMWCVGSDWGGSAFGGGIGWAGEFWGTSLKRKENVSVEFLFTPEHGQKAYRYVRDDSLYRFADFETVPFVCRRTVDSVVLNVLFLDNDSDGSLTWFAGARERADHILVAKSAYNPIPSDVYSQALFPGDALDVDVMYVVALNARQEYDRHQIKDGQVLHISVEPEGDPLPVDTVEFGNVIVGHEKSIPLLLVSRFRAAKRCELYITTPGSFILRQRDLDLGSRDTGRVSIEFVPNDTVYSEATLTISVPEYSNRLVGRVLLSGSGQPWPLEGDIDRNGVLDLLDITAYLRHLYWAYIPPYRSVRLDLDGLPDVTLSDLMILINKILRDS